MERNLCSIILIKIEHQIDRLDHLTTLIPDDQLDWVPPIPSAFPLAILLGHLLESLAGFCAVLYAAHPVRLRHFEELKKRPVNTRMTAGETRTRMGEYRERIREGLAALQDLDLGRMLSTVFVAEGESILSLLLTNIEHLASHKYQLFVYLRLLGVAVASKDLYHFSGEAEKA